MHAALDLGNSVRTNIPVYAGMQAFWRHTYSRQNNKVWLRSGNYVTTYQHVADMVPFTEGAIISPERKIAEIEMREASIIFTSRSVWVIGY